MDNALESQLADMDTINSIRKQSPSEVSKEQVVQVITKIQKIKDLDFKTTLQAVAALFRRGAANAGAPDTMEIEVSCPATKNAVEITRYDISMAMQSIVGHRNVRKLAEAIAPELISACLKLIKQNPLLDLKGDLANRINRKLSLRKEQALSREEEICCSTYAQWMPNLNELAGSNRLKNLLDEDLNARRKKNSKPSKQSNISKKGRP